MVKTVITNTVQHWKTTLLGALLAAFEIFKNGADWKHLAYAAAVAALGAIAKDWSSK